MSWRISSWNWDSGSGGKVQNNLGELYDIQIAFSTTLLVFASSDLQGWPYSWIILPVSKTHT